MITCWANLPMTRQTRHEQLTFITEPCLHVFTITHREADFSFPSIGWWGLKDSVLQSIFPERESSRGNHAVDVQ